VNEKHLLLLLPLQRPQRRDNIQEPHINSIVVVMFLGTPHAVHPETNGDQYKRMNLLLHPINPLLRHVMIDCQVRNGKDPVQRLTDLGELRILLTR
jgi:hypothetical protein